MENENVDHSDESSKKEEDEEEEEETNPIDHLYNHCFRSIRSSTGLEIGIAVTWPGLTNEVADDGNDDDANENCPKLKSKSKPWVLSTCLSSDCIAPLFHGTQWAGSRVWTASVVALLYLLSKDLIRDKDDCHEDNNMCSASIGPQHTLIELGCGLGIPGMILHALNGCRVVLTDRADLIPTIERNLLEVFPPNGSSENRNNIIARALDWSSNGSIAQLHEDCFLFHDDDSYFDLVLNCDCIFEPLYGDSWKLLLQSQQALLKLNPRAFVLTVVERRKFDGIDKYLQYAVAEARLSVQALHPTSFVVPSQIELYRLSLPVD